MPRDLTSARIDVLPRDDPGVAVADSKAVLAAPGGRMAVDGSLAVPDSPLEGGGRAHRLSHARTDTPGCAAWRFFPSA